MAITFFQQSKKQKYLLVGLISITVVAGGLVWYIFFQQGQGEIPSFLQLGVLPPEKIQIDFQIFQHPIFQELEDPAEPLPLLVPEELGKENPFAPE
ncbi:MAG: hypothetical protein AAB567_01995 [Patescibacteria group bacterium]